MCVVSSSKNAKIHSLAVALLSSCCLLSGEVLADLVRATAQPHYSNTRASTAGERRSGVLLRCVSDALVSEGMQVRERGVLELIETLHGCILHGHKAQNESSAPAVEGQRLCDVLADDDIEEIELREMMVCSFLPCQSWLYFNHGNASLKRSIRVLCQALVFACVHSCMDRRILGGASVVHVCSGAGLTVVCAIFAG